MSTQTWSFSGGAEEWTFRDDSVGTGSATMVYNGSAQSLQFHLIAPDGPPYVERVGRGTAISPVLEVPVVLNDTIDFDFSAPTPIQADGPGHRITAIYDDETSDTVFVATNAASTLTLTFGSSKTLVSIEVQADRGFIDPGSTDMTIEVLEVRLTAAGGVSSISGKLRLPQNVIGPGAAGGSGGGSGGNLADISADGTYIYIAAFNSLGFPTVIRMPTALDADGSVVFEPNAGARIGVQAGRLNATHLWIAGQFDGTNTVEKSEDSGDTWTVKDDGSFGAIRTFEVGPANDEAILIFDGDNSDIIETTDDGATWITRNASTVVLLNSVARLDVNPEEIASVNVAGAANGAFYSINTGVNLEDIDDATYPNEEGTKVVVF